MGIFHFAGLGASPGAVTAGLSFIAKKHGKHHSEYGSTVESLILLTSPEVADGSRPSNEAVDNDYGNVNVKQRWSKGSASTIKIITTFIENEFPTAKVYLITMNINDIEACFEAIGRAALRFHEPGKVGKHIWANITGGTNVLNAALLQVAYLSGCIPWIYYTFVADYANAKYLRPFTNDLAQCCYEEVPIVKTQYDQRRQRVLEQLQLIQSERSEAYVSSQDLLNRLKNAAWQDFAEMNLETFKREFLNVMQGVERRGDRQVGQEDLVRLGQDGQQILERTNTPLFRALVQRERCTREELSEITEQLNIQELR